MKYKILKKNIFKCGKYLLIPLREADIYQIMEWRNAQMDILRQNKKLIRKDQLKYYNNIIKPTFSQELPSQILFSFLYSNACIGYGGLTNIDWEEKKAEVSFLVDPQRNKKQELYEKDFSAFLSLLKTIAFNNLWLNKLFTETYDVRPLHIQILEKNGFKYKDREKNKVKIRGKHVDSLLHLVEAKDENN